MTNPLASETELRDALEQRADYIPLNEILDETSIEGDSFQNAFAELTNKSLRTLVGPRGSGKTHLMRYTWAKCQKDDSKPLAIYVSFNRYLRLEPLKTTKPNPMELFHSWALSLICLGAYESAVNWQIEVEDADEIFGSYGLSKAELITLIDRLERGQPLSGKQSDLAESLSISRTQKLIDDIREKTNRKFSILLLDDAALTLAPDFLVDFLDIVRALKTSHIAPKASVYPGTTEYSPRFHAGQDTLAVSVWHPVDSEDYSTVMGAIAAKRVPEIDTIPEDIVELLKYAAFGIPRAYLSMLWEFRRRKFRTSQQGLNQIIQDYLNLRLAEYRTLSKKVPKFATIIKHGETTLNEMILAVKTANIKASESNLKQTSVGVIRDDITPLIKRMFNLLVEAGLVYDQKEIKHGSPERIYQRYVPHTAALLDIRAFSHGYSGTGARQIVAAIKRRSAKHPIRKKLLALSPEAISTLKVDLPECSVCGAPRLTEDQRFCHECGSQLITPSTFTKCCEVSIKDVPGLTKWQRETISKSLPKFKTIGDYLAKQDPGAELLTIYGIGKKRSTKIVDVLNGFIDEFLT